MSFEKLSGCSQVHEAKDFLSKVNLNSVSQKEFMTAANLLTTLSELDSQEARDTRADLQRFLANAMNRFVFGKPKLRENLSVSPELFMENTRDQLNDCLEGSKNSEIGESDKLLYAEQRLTKGQVQTRRRHHTSPHQEASGRELFV